MEPLKPKAINDNLTAPRQASYIRRDNTRPKIRVQIQDVRLLKVSPTMPIKIDSAQSESPKPFVQPSTERQNGLSSSAKVGRRTQRSNVMMRKVVKKPQATSSEADSVVIAKKRNKKSLILILIAGLVFLAGIAISYDGWRTNKKIEAQVTSATSNNQITPEGGSTEAPSTEKPSSGAVSSYAVAPDMPRYFKMPQHGITKARILPMGVDKNNTLKSPSNVHDVGWYDASSRPGQGGAVLLDAHVSSWTTSGVFYHIKDLKPGDTVSVERGDGQEFTYRVVKSETYDYKNVDMMAAILPITEGKGGLNMITCAGKVIPGTNEFDKRIIVFTEQV